MLAGRSGILWDLTAPPDAEPLRLQWGGFARAFHPEGRWLATRGAAGDGKVSLWPLTRPYPRVLTGHAKGVFGRSDSLQTAVSWSPHPRTARCGCGLSPAAPVNGPGSCSKPKDGWTRGGARRWLRTGPSWPSGTTRARSWFCRSTAGPRVSCPGSPTTSAAVAVGPEARLVAAGSGRFDPKEAVVRVWDLETGEVRILDAGDGEWIRWLRFTGEGELLVRSWAAIRRWDLAGGAPRIVDEIDLSRWDLGGEAHFDDLSPDGREVLFVKEGRLWIQDLDGHATRELAGDLSDRRAVWFDPTGRLVLAERHAWSSPGLVGARRRAPSAPGARGRGRTLRRLPGRSVDRLRRGRRHRPSLAHARCVAAAAPHPAPRRAAREAEDAHEPAGGAGSRVLHRLEDRGRPLPRVGDRSNLATPAPPRKTD